MGRHARDHRDLDAYRIAREVSRELFVLTRRFPREERYSLTAQLLRSSRSVGAQLAEAWAKRRYQKHFISKLTDADAEQRETRHWVEVAEECGYLADADARRQLAKLHQLGRLLYRMIQKAPHFCQSPPD